MANYVKSTNFAVKDGLPSGDPQKVVKGTEIDTEFNNISTAVNSKSDASNPTFLGTPFAPTASPGTATNQIATTAFVQAVKESLHPVGSIYINATNSTNPGTLLGFGTWAAFGAGRVPVGFNAADSLFDTAEETGGSKDAIVVSHTHTVSSSGTTGNQSVGHTHTFSGNTGGQSANHTHTFSEATSSNGVHSHNVRNGTGGSSTNPLTSDRGFSGMNDSGSYDSFSNIVQEAGSHNHTVSGTTSTVSSDHSHGYSGTTSDASSTSHNHSVTVSGTTASAGSSGTNANLQPYITVFMFKRVA
jgi:hypothetical protein